MITMTMKLYLTTVFTLIKNTALQKNCEILTKILKLNVYIYYMKYNTQKQLQNSETVNMPFKSREGGSRPGGIMGAIFTARRQNDGKTVVKC